MGWRLTLAVAAVALLPLASAGTPILEAHTQSATARDDPDVAGVLASLLMEDRGAGGNVAPLRLEGARLHVETDVSDPTIHAPGVGQIRLVPDVTETTSARDYVDAALTTEANRPNFRANLYPLDAANPPHVSLDTTCATFQTTDATTLTRVAMAYQPRPDIRLDLSSTVMAVPCGVTQLHIQGDVMLSLWETDGRLDASDGSVNITTGSTESGGPAVSRLAEVFVTARNATVTLPLAGNMDLYLGKPQVSGAYALEFRAASGTLDLGGSSTDLAGQATTIRGDITTYIQGSTKGLDLAADGQVASAQVGATTLAAVVSAPSLVDSPWLTASILLATIFACGLLTRSLPLRWLQAARSHGEVPAGYVTLTSRHRRAGGYWVKAQEWLDRGWLRRARWASGRATRLRPESVPHQLLRVAVLDELGKPVAALRSLQHFYDKVSKPRERAAVALEVAASLARMGRRAEAEEWLERAQADDPAAVAEAHRDSYFQAIHGRPAPRRIHDADPSIA